MAYIANLEEQLRDLSTTRSEVNHLQDFFGLSASTMDEMSETAAEVALKKLLWQGHCDFQALCAEWAGTPYREIDLAIMDESIQKMQKDCRQLERALPPNHKVPQLRKLVDEHKEVLPVLTALANPALKEQHWAKLSETAGIPLSGPDGAELTLSHLLKMQITSCQTEITQTSFEATQEAGLEQMLAQLNAKWADLEFSVTPFKDSAILCALDIIIETLEDSMMTMATIQSSRYVDSIQNDVDRTARALSQFSETLDEWQAVQKGWMYLESIFSAPDIQVSALVFEGEGNKALVARKVSCTCPDQILLNASAECRHNFLVLQKHLQLWIRSFAV
jgi:dynein heavy chain, axonemal